MRILIFFKTAVQCPAGAEPGSSSNGAAESLYMRARRRRLEQLLSHICSEEENEIEKSQEHWTQVGLPSSELDLLLDANYHYFHERLLEKWPFIEDYGDRLVVGKKIAEGGQAEIFEATIDGDFCVLKVFMNNYSLADLQSQWVIIPPPGFNRVSFLKLMKDGSFAFVMDRYWGDLHKLIDLRMKENNHQGPRFQYPVNLMLQIAEGMRLLHHLGILHRDLKASNVLLQRLGASSEYGDIDAALQALRAERIDCYVADFECCRGVMGTGFGRAPEVLRPPKIWTRAADIYSFAMTCYEILTGCKPFGHLAPNDYDAVVVRGERPPLPNYVDYRIQQLLKRCWHSEPSERPEFYEIVDELQDLMHWVPAFICPVPLEPWFKLLGENPTLDEILSISKLTILPLKIPVLSWE